MLEFRHLEHVGATLRQLRLAAGFSQAELCARTGMLPPQLSRWENGHDAPTLESLVKFLVTTGASLADFERELFAVEEEERRAALRKELRRIRASHQERIASSAGLRRAIGRIMRPGPGGLEGSIRVPEEKIETSDTPASDSSEAIDPDLEHLVDGLPGTLEQILADPRWRRPAVVEHLVESSRALLDARHPRSVHVAEAARLLAAELPETFERVRRFRLRARSLERWAMAQRAVGESLAAEAALLCAFELMAQVEGAEPADLASILGRLALLARDPEGKEDLAPYAADAARFARIAGRDPER